MSLLMLYTQNNRDSLIDWLTGWLTECLRAQDTQLGRHAAFQGAVQSSLINCGTYNEQPVFVIRHYRGNVPGPQFVYSVHTCKYAPSCPS